VKGDSSVSGEAKINRDFECYGNVEMQGGMLVSGDMKGGRLSMKGGILVMGKFNY